MERISPPPIAEDDNGLSALHEAAANKQDDLLVVLLESESDVNIQDQSGDTPLATYSRHGDTALEVVLKFLRCGANPFIFNHDHETCLHVAASSGSVAVVRGILDHVKVGSLERVVGIDAVDKSQKTALHLAATNTHDEVLEFLLDHNAAVNNQDVAGDTALHIYLRNQEASFKVVKKFLQHGADPSIGNNNLDTCLHDAASHGREEIVRSLLDSKVYQIRKVEMFLFINAQNKDGSTALHLAGRSCKHHMLELLLDQSAAVNTQDQDGDTALHEYSRNRTASHRVVKKFIQHGTDPNIRNEKFETCLHDAAYYGAVEVVKCLLDPKLYSTSTCKVEVSTFIDAANTSGCTALHNAATGGMDEVLEVLLDHNAAINVRTNDGDTALHRYARNGGASLNIVKKFLQNGADPSIRNDGLDTCLHDAAYYGALEVVKALLDPELYSNRKVEMPHIIDDISSLGSTALHYAARGGKDQALELLLDHDATVNIEDQDGDTALHEYVRNEEISLKVVEKLLRHGADPSIRNNKLETCLYIAVDRGTDAEVVRGVLDLCSTCDVEMLYFINAADAKGSTTLHIAARKGMDDLLEVLLDHNAAVNVQSQDGDTALHEYMRNEDATVDIVKKFLHHGADPTIRNRRLETCLHDAAYFVHVEVVRCLLDPELHKSREMEMPLFIDAQSKLGTTALHFAVRKGNDEVMKLLLHHNATAKVQDRVGNTALHEYMIAQEVTLRVVKKFLQCGADPSIRNNDLRTCLHDAVENASVDIVKAFLERGLCKSCPLEMPFFIDAKDKQGFTALHLAAGRGEDEILELLIGNNAMVNVQAKAGEIALHRYLKKGTAASSQVVKNLLKHGADPSILNNKQENSLHVAAFACSVEVVKCLMDPPVQGPSKLIDINAKDRDGLTALHIAAKREDGEVVVELLGHKLKPDAGIQDVWGDTPLHKYSENMEANSDLVKLFLQHGAVVSTLNKRGMNSIHVAASCGNTVVVRSLIAYQHERDEVGVNMVDKNGRTALHWAAANNHISVVEELLKHPVDVNLQDAREETALMAFCQRSRLYNVDVALAEALVQHGADVLIENAKGLNCIHVAASKGHVSLMRALLMRNLQAGSSTTGSAHAFYFNQVQEIIDSTDSTELRRTALHHAVAENQNSFLQEFLSYRPRSDLELEDGDGCTALMLFCEESADEDVDVAESLLVHGANPFVRNKGLNCLHVAVSRCQVALVKTLLRSDSDLQLVNSTSTTTLEQSAVHLAAVTNNVKVFEELLSHSADVNKRDADGRTALMIAANGGHKEVLKLLLDQSRDSSFVNADLLICDNEGFSCLHVSAFKGDYETIRILLEKPSERSISEASEESQTKVKLMELRSPKQGLTPLHMATIGHHLELAFWLLERYKLLSVYAQGFICPGDPLYNLAWFNSEADRILENVLPFTLNFDEVLEDNMEAIVHSRDPILEDKFLNPIKQLLVTSGDGTRTKQEIKAKLSETWRSVCDSLPGYRALHRLRDAYTGPDKTSIDVRLFDLSRLVEVYANFIEYCNAKDYVGRTALHYVATSCTCKSDGKQIQGCIPSLKGILKVQAVDINPVDRRGHTPLHLAIKRGNEGVAESILEIPCCPEVEGSTTLRYSAAAKYASEGVNWDPVKCEDLKDLDETLYHLWEEAVDGATPLHYAMMRLSPSDQLNDSSLVSKLIAENEIDLIARTKDGVSPFTIALSRVSIRYWLDDQERTVSKSNLLCPPISYITSHPVGYGGVESDEYRFFQSLEERAIVPKDIANPEEEQIKLWVELLWSLRELIEKKRVSGGEKEQMLESMRKDKYHWKGLSVLHYAAFRGRSDILNTFMIKCGAAADTQAGEGYKIVQQFTELFNMPYATNGQTPLHFAVNEGHIAAVKFLADPKFKLVRVNEEDGYGRTAYELVIEKMEMDVFPSSRMKELELTLLAHPDVKAYIEKQYRDRQIYVDAGNTALVGAALIAGVTFAGWLQPPLGYTVYPQYDPEQFAAVEQYLSVHLFFIFNSLSFFTAVTTVACGARAVLPAPSNVFIAKEVRLIRKWLVRTSVLLVISIVCVLLAFGAAGFAALPRNIKYQANMIVTTGVGGLCCLISLGCFFHRLLMIRTPDWRLKWWQIPDADERDETRALDRMRSNTYRLRSPELGSWKSRLDRWASIRQLK